MTDLFGWIFSSLMHVHYTGKPMGMSWIVGAVSVNANVNIMLHLKVTYFQGHATLKVVRSHAADGKIK